MGRRRCRAEARPATTACVRRTVQVTSPASVRACVRAPGPALTGSIGPADRRTEEGYRIYTAEELGIGKGGGTADCPFDCDCCF